ncbi:hypothetical protein RRV45_12100 [Bacillus sp. DTU_2020_1000418_1_SI_GHA_SEK_038]|uniref:hypothetical protein n=1 Tax=Bacillus sp. DTU_2020_1000418_1_SI_GHA_SEK_038 TaxID=3077585 RepID=UPI0028E60135|nr:hypothetical protein [Bacillus sp. DTU_2020_1000418_1_SI_GHA_SEK_038]WNS73661.1 hypothetical protein RRV45_12100 [Bacillus sp. DTU_2020_1000418_1_SI_GHA_SEK_038]
MSIWIDIDKPTKHFGVHSKNKSRNPKCKGINEMLRDGGWFDVASIEEAFELHKRSYSNYTIVDRTDKYPE